MEEIQEKKVNVGDAMENDSKKRKIVQVQRNLDPKHGRPLIKPTKHQLWMMMAKWTAYKADIVDEVLDPLGFVILDNMGALVDCGWGCGRKEECEHKFSSCVVESGKLICSGGSLYVSQSIECTVCLKIIVQAGFACIFQLTPDVHHSVNKSGSRQLSGNTSTFENHHQNLYMRSGVALHDFYLDPFQYAKLQELKFLFGGEDQTPDDNRIHYYMGIAYILRERSDDVKTGCGSVFVKKGKIIAVGWNGFISNATRFDFPSTDAKVPFMLHAEQNALIYHRIGNLDNVDVFVTRLPCSECSPLLNNAGKFLTVYYCAIPSGTPEKDKDGIDLIRKYSLENSNITFKRVVYGDFHEGKYLKKFEEVDEKYYFFEKKICSKLDDGFLLKKAVEDIFGVFANEKVSEVVESFLPAKRTPTAAKKRMFDGNDSTEL